MLLPSKLSTRPHKASPPLATAQRDLAMECGKNSGATMSNPEQQTRNLSKARVRTHQGVTYIELLIP